MKTNENQPVLIKNGHIIDPASGTDCKGTILIQDGIITQVAIGDKHIAVPENCNILDAEGLTVCPGFIDLHCHLRQPGHEEKETIATGSRAAARGGFTTVCCMPNTNPPLDSAELITYTLETAGKEAAVRVLPLGCVSHSREGHQLADLSTMADAGAVGFSDDGSSVFNEKVIKQALEWSKSSDIPIIEHCEDASVAPGWQINEGAVAQQLGLKGMPPEVEERIIARDIALAKSTGGRLHIAHTSTAGAVELIRQAKSDGVAITAEVTPHHLTLDETTLLTAGTQAKVSPPLRSKQDIEAVRKALAEGVIDCIATDHAPHTLSDKDCTFEKAAFGISGFETAFGSVMELVHQDYVSLTELVAYMTTIPAAILGKTGNSIGALKPGYSGDITIVHPDKEWIVDTTLFASKGRNTPLSGALLKGKVAATIYRGKLVYRDETMFTA